LKGKDLNGNPQKVSDKRDSEKAPKMYEIGMGTQGLGRGPREFADIARDRKNQKLTAEARRNGKHRIQAGVPVP
jgi:hypothetical protein